MNIINLCVHGKAVKFVFMLMLAIVFQACSSGKTPQSDECVDAGKPKIIEITPLKIKTKKEGNWCQACVLAKASFASCQRIWEQTPNEDIEKIRQRAKDAACKDAGYPIDNCPKEKIISLICIGETLPPGTTTPGKALQNVFKGQKFNLVQTPRKASAKENDHKKENPKKLPNPDDYIE